MNNPKVSASIYTIAIVLGAVGGYTQNWKIFLVAIALIAAQSLYSASKKGSLKRSPGQLLAMLISYSPLVLGLIGIAIKNWPLVYGALLAGIAATAFNQSQTKKKQ